jgi:hypothetical protein
MLFLFFLGWWGVVWNQHIISICKFATEVLLRVIILHRQAAATGVSLESIIFLARVKARTKGSD